MFKKFALSVVAFVTMATGSLQAGNLFCCDGLNFDCRGDNSAWGGLYVGIHGGYVWTRFNQHDNTGGTAPLFNRVKFDANGGDFGFHFGYNWANPCNNVVFSIENSFDWMSGSKSKDAGHITVNARIHSKPQWFYSVTPRIGFAFCEWMLYFKGGLAFARFKHSIDVVADSVLGSGGFTRTTNNWGPTFGVGVEYLWACSWIIGVEYNYFDYGKRAWGRRDHVTHTAGVQSVKVHPQQQEVVIRLGYKF